LDRLQIWTVGLKPNSSWSAIWNIQNYIWSIRYDIFIEAVKFVEAEFAQARQILPRRIWVGSSYPYKQTFARVSLVGYKYVQQRKTTILPPSSSLKPSPNTPNLLLHHHWPPMTVTSRLCLPPNHRMEKNNLIRAKSSKLNSRIW